MAQCLNVFFVHAIISLSVVATCARDLNTISLPVGSNCVENHITSVAGLMCYAHTSECQFLFWSILGLPPSHLSHSVHTIHHGRHRDKNENTSLFPLRYPATFTKRPARTAHSIALFIEINQAHLSFTQSHKTHLTFFWFSECQSEQQPCPPLTLTPPFMA